MPGLLSFTLALQNSQFKSAVAASTQQENQFTESVKAATKRLKEQHGVLNSSPKPAPPAMPEPVPEKHVQSVRHLRHELALVSELAGQLGSEFGNLGRLAGLVFNPYLVGIAAVSMVLEIFIKQWEKLRETEESWIALQQGSANTAAEAHVSAVMGMARANTEFRLSLLHSADGIDRETQAMEDRITVFRSMVDAQNDVFQAQTRATEAQIDADEAIGRISSTEALKRRQAQELLAMQSGFTAQNDIAQEAIDEKMKRQADAHRNLATAVNAHDDAVAAAAPNKEALERQEHELQIREKLRDEAQEAARKAQSAKDSGWEQFKSTLPNAIGDMHPDEAAAFTKKQAENAEALVVKQKEIVEGLRNRQLPLDANIEKAKKEADIEQEKINSLTHEIQLQMQLLDINKQKQKGEEQAKLKADKAERERKKKEILALGMALMEPSAFEKKGFSFGGRNAPTLFSDHNFRAAVAAEQCNMTLRQILDILRARPNDPGAMRALNSLVENGMP
jgi:hypothetical protein